MSQTSFCKKGNHQDIFSCYRSQKILNRKTEDKDPGDFVTWLYITICISVQNCYIKVMFSCNSIFLCGSTTFNAIQSKIHFYNNSTKRRNIN